MAEISSAKRKALPKSAFADPANRAFPVHDKAHADNAAARLEQQKGSMSPAKYKAIKSRISAAQKRFGEAPKKKKAMRAGPALRMTFDHPAHGRFEIRHMRDGARQLRASFALADDAAAGDGPVWVQIATRGHFNGHSAGPFDLNDGVFADIVRNFRDVDQGRVAFDFEHASEAEPSAGAVPQVGAPAQGWIRDLSVREDGLYALVDWLEPARTYIREKKYRFVSPAIRFGARDPKSGKPIGARLTSVALTNQPFLRDLRPLAAKDVAGDGEDVTMRSGMAHSTHEYMPRLRSALKVHELATPAECAGHVQRLRALLDAADGDAGAMYQGVRLSDYLHPLRDLTHPGAMGATWEDVFNVVDDLIDAAIDEHEIAYHGASPDEDEDEDTPGEASMADDGDSEGEEPEETTMADRETDSRSIQLTADNAELRLQLGAEKARADQAEGELKKLRDWKAEHEQRLLRDRVDEAFETYKDKKSLNDSAKEWMLIVLSTKPEAFEREYPRVPIAQRHIFRDLSGARPPTPEPTPIAGNAQPVKMSTLEIANRLMQDEKLPYLEAIEKAHRMKATG